MYENVIQQSGIPKDMITYVEAHGTGKLREQTTGNELTDAVGTQAGDPVEVASVRKVLGDANRTDQLYLGSVKGNIGHCETAAGIAGLLKVICMSTEIIHYGIATFANSILQVC
jgi:acyl transferase domain-containing protein